MSTNAQQQSQWTIKRLLEWTTGYLNDAGVDQGRLSAEILLAHSLGCQRIELYTRFDYCPDPDQMGGFREQVKRCAAHEPVAYLTGKAHFYSLELSVSPAVLVPRPETETLVTQAIDFLRSQTLRPTVDMLDLCTGSGCIAVAVAQNVVEAEVLAIDSSVEAIEIARKNIEKYDLQGRVTLAESDLFSNINQAQKTIFDLIVSNPPYISSSEYDKLDPVVRDYEPRQALWAGDDGLDYYRRIVAEAQPYLGDNGALMVEVAYNQAEQVTQLFEQSDYLTDIDIVKDNLGHQRVIIGQKSEVRSQESEEAKEERRR